MERFFDIHGARVDEIVWSKVVTSGVVAYHHYDARTHCMMLTGTGQNIIEQYDYDAFGRVYAYNAAGAALTVGGRPGSPYGNRFFFTGREWLWDLGVYEYRHRHYNPELGRFLQPDPKHFGAGDYNLYRYCHNDPVNRADSTGLYENDVHHDLTRYLAVEAGFPAHMAVAIARANQGTDDSRTTGPFVSQEARRLFHFTSAARREEMRELAYREKSLDRFGEYLHAYQDSFSHQKGRTDRDGEPYGAKVGHLFDGHDPDKTNKRPELADRMAEGTYRELQKFLEHQSGSKPKDRWSEVQPSASRYLRHDR